MDVKMDGTDELVRNFKAMKRGLQGKALEAATRAAALPVQNTLKLSVNNGGRTPYLSGTLRRSFEGEAAIEVTERALTRCVVTVGTNLPYARRLELGFVGADSLGRIYNQPPRPFIRPALDENQKRVQGEFRLALKQIIRRLAPNAK